jgi:hypothetical protein
VIERNEGVSRGSNLWEKGRKLSEAGSHSKGSEVGRCEEFAVRSGDVRSEQARSEDKGLARRKATLRVQKNSLQLYCGRKYISGK